MNNKNLDKLAYETALFWANNCEDEEFYDNCMDTICNELEIGSGVIPNEAYKVWDIIENKYLNL